MGSKTKKPQFFKPYFVHLRENFLKTSHTICLDESKSLIKSFFELFGLNFCCKVVPTHYKKYPWATQS